MERCNYISVDAPLNFIVFSTIGKSLCEFHPIKYVGSVPNSSVIAVLLPSLDLEAKSSAWSLQMTLQTWRDSEVTLSTIACSSLRRVQGYDSTSALFSYEMIHFTKEKYQVLWAWLRSVSYRSLRKRRSLFEGIYTIFSTFPVSLCLSWSSFPIAFKEKKDVRMNLSRNRGNSCQNGFSHETWSRHGWLYYIKERKIDRTQGKR
jgi:hypothetical protein